MKYFTIKELSHSDMAIKIGITNTPDDEAVGNILEANLHTWRNIFLHV